MKRDTLLHHAPHPVRSDAKAMPKPKYIALALALLGPAAFAGPVGGNISAGAGAIGQSGTTTTITQQSQNLAIDWQSFSIASGEAVNFIQPNASSIALNRVLGQDASSILGSLTANGQVFILNPNGILFGSTAQVSVGGLVASTLNLSDADFIAGNYSFTSGGNAGTVVNQGTLNAADGGYIAMLAPQVRNDGSITANSGTALMAAADKVTLSLNNGSLLSYTVDQGTLKALAENNQLIRADGGQVILTAQAADALGTAVVNNTGIIEARTINNAGGVIKLLGDMQAGTVNAGGMLNASAPDGGDGGFVETSAAHVRVADSARITTASSQGNSGIWLIDPVDFTIAATGGDMTGAALSANLGSGNVTILSSSGGAGTAGNVNVNDTVTWSANTLTLNAQNNININTAMYGSGTAGLALEYGQGAVAAGNTSTYYVNAPVNLASTGSFSTKLGSDGVTKNYTIITGLGAAGSTTGTDLQGMSGNLTGNYVLGANIDASATSGWSGGAGFAPVHLNGSFDGLGHTINNLAINRPTTNSVGLFGSTGTNFVVRNLGLAGGSVTGQDYVGGLVGYNRGLVNSSYATVTVSGRKWVGGLAGFNNKSISASYASGNVSSTGDYVGGLAGYNNFGTSTISACYATGSVSSSIGIAGGLVGQNNGTISNSYSSGSVSSGATAGVGGLVGFNFLTVSNSFWDTQTSGQATSDGGTGMATADMMTLANFTSATAANGNVNPNWDFTNTWFMVDGATRPFLRSEYSTTVSNAHQLQLMAMNLGASYTLAANVNLSESGNASGMWKTTSGFVPVGTLAAPFTGSFDGLTYSISNLSINLPTTDYVGLFGYISAATVTNANVSGSVTGNNYVGGIAGKTNNSSTVSSSSFTGSVTGNSFVGGIVGWNDPSTVTNVFVNGTVSGIASVGGIAGWNDGSTIDIASFSGSVTGTDRVGGLTGDNSGVSNVSNVIVAGNVNGTTNVGGVMGANTSTGSVSASYWDTQTSGQANAVGSGSGTGTTGLTSTEMNQQASFAGLDFVNTWRIYEGNSTPLLASFLTPLTITLNNASKTYDGQAYSGGNGYTTSLTPDANLLGSLAYTGSAQGAVNAGSYTISAGGFYSSQQGYDITVVNGTLTVNTAPLTITASNASKTYGNTQTWLGTEFASSGLVNNETIGTVTLSSTGDAATASVAGGPYVIAASAATGGSFNPANYSISYVNGQLTVNPLALIGSITGGGSTYGGVLNAGTAGFSNVVGNDIVTPDVVTVSTAGMATSGSGNWKAGTYTGAQTVGTTLGGADAGNYIFAGASADYTISQRVLTGASISAVNTTYGTVASSGTVSFSNLIVGDNISAPALINANLSTDVSSSGHLKAGSYYQSVMSLVPGIGNDSGNYLLSSPFTTATANYTVNPLALIGSITGGGSTYGGALNGGTVGFSNVVGNDNVTPDVVTVSTSGMTSSSSGNWNAGTYAGAQTAGTTLGGADAGNYTFAGASADYTIGQLALTVTADNATKTYGSTKTWLGTEFTSSGLVNNETIGSVALASTGDTATAGVSGSPYAVTASNATGGNFNPNNYTISYVDGLLTVLGTPAQVAESYLGTSLPTAYESALLTAGAPPDQPQLSMPQAAVPVQMASALQPQAGAIVLLNGGIRLPEGMEQE